MNKLSGSFLARNAGLNLVASIIPLPLALIAIPLLLRGIGIEKFGILTIAWALIGYAGFLDLGIGRAITKFCAESLESDIDRQLSETVSAGVVLLAMGGLVGAIALIFLAPVLATKAFHVTPGIEQETVWAIGVFAVCVPFVMSASALRGILEAFQRFDLVGYIRVASGILLILAPVVILPWTSRLEIIMGMLAVVRLLIWLALILAVRAAVPSLDLKIRFSLSGAAPLLKYGGWVTVSNVVGPVIVYFDRFVIAAVLSVSALAYYTTPFEAITKLWVIPSALVGVLFPAFSASFRSRPEACSSLYRNGVAITFAAMAGLAIFFMAFSKEVLAVWLDGNFSMKSGQVLCWLMLGVMFTGIAQVPYALIQATGRPDLTAKLHCIEIIPYAMLALLLIESMGVQGAAAAWAIRAGVDMILLSVIAGEVPSLNLGSHLSMRISLAAVLCGSIGLGGFCISTLPLKIVCVLIGWTIVLVVAWRYLTLPEDRFGIKQNAEQWMLRVRGVDGQ